MKISRSAQSFLTKMPRLIESIPGPCFVIDNQQCIVGWNKAMEELTHVKASEMLGKTNYEYALPFYGIRRPMLIDIFFKPIDEVQYYYSSILKKGNAHVTEEFASNLKNGTHLQTKVAPINNKFGLQIGALEIVEDRSDRVQTEELLAIDEYKYSTLFHHSNDGIFIVLPNENYRIKDANQKILDLFGYNKSEFFTIKFLDIFSKLQLENSVISNYLHDYMAEKTRIEETWQNELMEAIFVKKSGDEFVGEITFTTIRMGNNPLTYCIIRDITERKKMEHFIETEKELLAVTLRNIGDGVISVDQQGKVRLMNRVAEFITEWTQIEAINQELDKIFLLIDEETGTPVNIPLNSDFKQKNWILDQPNAVLVSRNGSRKTIAYKMTPILDQNSQIIGVVLVFQDITEKELIKTELIKAQKMESIGLLAGGIAHDFNNILMAILGNLSIAKMEVSTGTPFDNLRQILTEAEMATIRATHLTKQLLTFSKGGIPIKKVLNITQLISDTARFTLRGSKTTLELNLAEGLWSIEVDEGQFTQVINNIVLNADQAMPKGGKITIITENLPQKLAIFTSASSKSVDNRVLPEENYIHITIKDEGIGMTKEHLGKLFDPYFTTKKNGTGLGLSVCYSIIKNHKGYITVDSTVGVGTTFHIYLPARLKQDIYKIENQNPLPIESSKSYSGKLAILMDDEESIRSVFESMLKRTGFDVLHAKEGKELLELHNRVLLEGKKVDLIIMDLTIPGGMGGKETISILRKIDDKVNVLVSSGYSTDPIIANYQNYGFNGYLIKPFSIEELKKQLSVLIFNDPKH